MNSCFDNFFSLVGSGGASRTMEPESDNDRIVSKTRQALSQMSGLLTDKVIAVESELPVEDVRFALEILEMSGEVVIVSGQFDDQEWVVRLG